MKPLLIDKLPRLFYLPSLLVVGLLFLLQPFALQAWPVKFFRGYTRKIQPEPCITPSGDSGICMFAWDCMKSNGTHLGTCMDRYLVGSCCSLESTSLSVPMHAVDNMITEADVALLPLPSDTSDTIAMSDDGDDTAADTKPGDSIVLTETSSGTPQSDSFSSTQTPDSTTPASSTLETGSTLSTVESNTTSDSSTDPQTLPESDHTDSLGKPDRPDVSGISTSAENILESVDPDTIEHINASQIISDGNTTQEGAEIEAHGDPLESDSSAAISAGDGDPEGSVSEVVPSGEHIEGFISGVTLVNASGVQGDGTDDGLFGLVPVVVQPVSGSEGPQDQPIQQDGQQVDQDDDSQPDQPSSQGELQPDQDGGLQPNQQTGQESDQQTDHHDNQQGNEHEQDHNEIILIEQKPLGDTSTATEGMPLPPIDGTMLEKPESELPVSDISTSENEINTSDDSGTGENTTTITSSVEPSQSDPSAAEGSSQTDILAFPEGQSPDEGVLSVPSDGASGVTEIETSEDGETVPEESDIDAADSLPIEHQSYPEESDVVTTKGPQAEDIPGDSDPEISQPYPGSTDIVSLAGVQEHTTEETTTEGSGAEDAGDLTDLSGGFVEKPSSTGETPSPDPHPSTNKPMVEEEVDTPRPEESETVPSEAPEGIATEDVGIDDERPVITSKPFSVVNVTMPSTTTIPNSWDEVEIVISLDSNMTSITTTTAASSTTATSTTTKAALTGHPIILPDEVIDDITTTPKPLTADEQEEFLLEKLRTSSYLEVCGDPVYPSSRIVGGFEATYGEWPWQVSLRQWRSVAFLHKCGAALVNENWAITAAHCVEGIEPDQLLLVMGEYDLGRTTEPYGHIERSVQVTAMHPKFEPRTFEYDLALMRFSEPVVFQPNIIPICIPDDDYNFLNETGYVTGWGRLYEDGPLPTVMQKVPVPVIPNENCEDMYKDAGYIEHIPNIFICAGYQSGKQDSCEGDSGGPMVIRYKNRWRLGGIISWGIGCAVPNQPGVYTRISEFRDWINKIIIF